MSGRFSERGEKRGKREKKIFTFLTYPAAPVPRPQGKKKRGKRGGKGERENGLFPIIFPVTFADDGSALISVTSRAKLLSKGRRREREKGKKKKETCHILYHYSSHSCLAALSRGFRQAPGPEERKGDKKKKRSRLRSFLILTLLLTPTVFEGDLRNLPEGRGKGRKQRRQYSSLYANAVHWRAHLPPEEQQKDKEKERRRDTNLLSFPRLDPRKEERREKKKKRGESLILS